MVIGETFSSFSFIKSRCSPWIGNISICSSLIYNITFRIENTISRSHSLFLLKLAIFISFEDISGFGCSIANVVLSPKNETGLAICWSTTIIYLFCVFWVRFAQSRICQRSSRAWNVRGAMEELLPRLLPSRFSQNQRVPTQSFLIFVFDSFLSITVAGQTFSVRNCWQKPSLANSGFTKHLRILWRNWMEKKKHIDPVDPKVDFFSPNFDPLFALQNLKVCSF